MSKASQSLRSFYQALTRKKPLDCRTDTQLNRCLNLIDLTALGVGSTLGLGLYVLAGQVAANKAGPAVIVSFAFAALASAFSALCYAEFAARVPKAGSAYAYSYITVGEFVAFIIGWNMILEYVIGAASVARGFSGYIQFVVRSHFVTSSFSDSTAANLTGSSSQLATSGNLSTFVNSSVQQLASTSPSLLANSSATATAINSSSSGPNWLSLDLFANFDLLTLVIIFVITCLMLYGVKESTNFTMLFTCVNLMVVVTTVCGGLGRIDLHNWSLEAWELPQDPHRNLGVGGFMPYGWSGVLAGSATCFFGFIGFDTIASSAEEARNPRRNVPLAIILSLGISFLAYFATAAMQTLIWPYYDQNKIAVLPYIFDKLNMPTTYWILVIGAMAGLTSSQCGSIYPLPRTMYSMARDSIIYNYLSKINSRLQTPVRATIVGSLFIGLLACLLDIEELADMVSIGTLAAYSLVSVAVLILRYENRIGQQSYNNNNNNTMTTNRLSYPDITSSRHNSIVFTAATDSNHNFDSKQLDTSDGDTRGRTTRKSQLSLAAPHQAPDKHRSMADKRHQIYLLDGSTNIATNNVITAKTAGNYVNNIKQHIDNNQDDKRKAVRRHSVSETSASPSADQSVDNCEPNKVDRNNGDRNNGEANNDEPKVIVLGKQPRVRGSRPVSMYYEMSCAGNNIASFDSDTVTTLNGSIVTTKTTTTTTDQCNCFNKSASFDDTTIATTKSINSDQSIVKNAHEPSDATCSSSKRLIALSIFVIIILDTAIQLCVTQSIEFNFLAQLTIGVLVLIIIILSYLLSRLPTSRTNRDDAFRVPLVPLIPFLSILINTYLMLNLGYLTWLRFSIWMMMGFFIYFTYGIWNSTGYLIDN